MVQNARIAFLEASKKPHRTFQVAGGSGKIAAKGVTLLASKTTNITTKTAGRYALKRGVPVLCLIFGGISAYRSFKAYKKKGNNEEYYKGIAELVSAVAGLVPGGGIAIGLALDLGNLGHDIYKMNNQEPDIETVHKILGLDYTQQLTKEEVDKAFRWISKLTHPDKMRESGEYNQNDLHELQLKINKSKWQIYNYHGL